MCVQVLVDFLGDAKAAMCLVCLTDFGDHHPKQIREWAEEHERTHEKQRAYWVNRVPGEEITRLGILMCPLCGTAIVPTVEAVRLHTDWHAEPESMEAF